VKRILALSPVPEGAAGYRLRLAQYAPHLRAAGFELVIEALYDTATLNVMHRPGHYFHKATGVLAGTLSRISTIARSGHYSAVWLYREAHPIGPPLLERWLARRDVPVVFDFDDAIYLANYSEQNRFAAALKRPGKTAEIIRRSRHVTAGNRELAAYARRFSHAVTVIPTVVDTAVWRPAIGDRTHRTPVIGWIGTPTTVSYLLGLGAALRDLARSHDYVLRVSGSGTPVVVPGVRVENVPWTLENEVELFATCDIGVYPLTDDEWSRGKCGLKAIQFMACGVPVVAAAVGVNQEIIGDGQSGFLARTPAEWITALRALLDSHDLRKRTGAAGREVIERAYSLRSTAPSLARVFEEVSARQGASTR
jgi:glycosyltransferase involved in cell wall biosynthesis